MKKCTDCNNVCLVPFLKAEVVPSGDVYACCPGFTDRSFGNLCETPFKEIWHGEVARELRRKILAGDFSSCNLDKCSAKFLAPVRPEWTETPPLPEHVTISPDYECNQKCITCRRSFITMPSEILKRLYGSTNMFLSMLENAKVVEMHNFGDPFASRYCNVLIKRIVKDFPNIKFMFRTNGQLFTKENLETLGIYNRVHQLIISVDSLKKETYEKICLGAKFKNLLSATELAAEMFLKKHIEHIEFSFVLSVLNYRELPDFFELCVRYGATPRIELYTNWGVQSEDEAWEFKVYNPVHREYDDFITVARGVVEKYKSIIKIPSVLLNLINGQI